MLPSRYRLPNRMLGLPQDGRCARGVIVRRVEWVEFDAIGQLANSMDMRSGMLDGMQLAGRVRPSNSGDR
jgi:hypothetical protein